MKKFLLGAFMATALISSASAQSVGEKTGVNSALGITPKTEDFIKEAATSDMLEIAAAKIAQEKGNAGEKKFAEQMITDHTKTSTELKGMVPSNLQSAIPSSLDDTSQKKLDTQNLKILQGNTIQCRSARTRMLYRCLSAIPNAAITTS
jgi:putative membrane protein